MAPTSLQPLIPYVRRLQSESGNDLDLNDPTQFTVLMIGCAVFVLLILCLLCIYGKRRFWQYFETEEGRGTVVKFFAAFGYPPAVEEARQIRERDRARKQAIVDDHRRQIALLFSAYNELPRMAYKDFPTLVPQDSRAVPPQNSAIEATQCPAMLPPPQSDHSRQTLRQPSGQINDVGLDEERDHLRSCTICMVSFDAESCCVFLPCSHIYHDRCLRKWYETGKAIDGACPLCKRSIIPASMTEATESDDHNNAENGSNISGEGENASSAQVEMASSVPELTHQAAGAV